MTERVLGESPDRGQVEELFLEALEIPPAQREAFLATRCAHDPGLLAEVASLLAAHEGPGPLPGLDDVTSVEGRFPERIGAYRIVRVLGEGGMGVVLLAIREGAGFEQTVALKLIRGSWADPHLVRRLEEERRILAMLEHPGIARLVDGGVTPDGHPFYAMEYVPGEDVLRWCDARGLTLEDRLRLFVQVCDAVHHAHQQLVVHRDLKPSNILVTAEGLPKLLDFGIAKNLEAVAPGEHTTQWITPAYASPEQVTGGLVTTLSDVYALGVLLCELLAGGRPYETTGKAPGELIRIIGQAPPRRPSEVAADLTTEGATGRRTTPQRLARVLRGDLDMIVLKALAKEPQRRYGSAWALGRDVERFLEGRPVEARPDGAGYRAGKFVRRHRALVGAGALLALAVVAGTAGIAWQAHRASVQRDRAEAEASRARQVTALMTEIFRLGDPTQAVGDTVGIRQVLDEGALRVEATLGDDPVVQATLFLELARIYRNLGLLGEARRLGARALELRAAGEGGTLPHAEILGFQGMVLRDAGETADAVARLEEAIALRERLLPALDTTFAELLTALAWEVRQAGEHERAGALFSRALGLQRGLLGPAHPVVATTMLGLAATYHDQGSFDQAEELFRSALEPGRPEPSPVAATALVNLGMVQRLRERFADAEPILRTGLDMRLSLFDPAHPDVVEARQELVADLLQLGRYAEAERLSEENLRVAVAALGEAHVHTRGAREALGMIDHELGRHERALARLDSARAAKVRALGPDHPGIVFSLNAMGDVLVDAGRADEAEARYHEALDMGARLGGNRGTYGALSRHGLARAALARGDVAGSEELLDEALAMALDQLREDHRYVLEMQRTRARILLARGRAGEAATLLGRVVEAERGARPTPHPRVGATLLLLAQARLALGDTAGAEAARAEAKGEFAGLPGDHPLRRAAQVGAAGDHEFRSSASTRSPTLPTISAISRTSTSSVRKLTMHPRSR